MPNDTLATALRTMLPDAGPSLIEEILDLSTQAASVQKATRIQMIEEFIGSHGLSKGEVDWLELLIGLAHIHRGLHPSGESRE